MSSGGDATARAVLAAVRDAGPEGLPVFTGSLEKSLRALEARGLVRVEWFDPPLRMMAGFAMPVRGLARPMVQSGAN